jgi:hypothetical protein
MEDISKSQRDKTESFIFPMKSACSQLKNWKGMQPISKRQVLSGKLRFNMDVGFISNPKSLKSLKRGKRNSIMRGEIEVHEKTIVEYRVKS